MKKRIAACLRSTGKIAAICLPARKAFVATGAGMLLALAPGVCPGGQDVRDAMVKIYSVQTSPDYDNPWNMLSPQLSSGSGCLISGNRILTNAHVVGNQTFLQVRLHGKAKKYRARVLAVSHEADLALLGVEEPDFFEGRTPLQFGALPDVEQEVVVYGFPEGGDTLSTTRGVISRIEHQRYAHSTLELLAGQLDAAVNPGNSGGPVILEGRIVGVIMQLLHQAQNIGYMVPVPVIRHFMEDLQDGKYHGFPEDGILCQTMENRAIREKHGLNKEQTGALVISVLPGTPAEGEIFPGDVVLAVDGYDVADDCTVEFRPGERTSMNYCTQMHQVGEDMNLEILRDGEKRDLRVRLDTAWGFHKLIPMMLYDALPAYYIYGGLVFSPLTINYLLTWGGQPDREAPPDLVNYLLFDEPTVEGEEVVLMIKVLSSGVNSGYRDFVNSRITKVNGRKVKNLKELVRIVEEEPQDPYVAFTTARGFRMVLDRKEVEKEKEKIFNTYRIPSDCSENLREP